MAMCIFLVAARTKAMMKNSVSKVNDIGAYMDSFQLPELFEEQAVTTPKSRICKSSTIALAIFCFLCTCINIGIWLSSRVERGPKYRSPHMFESPSPYLGLDELEYDSHLEAGQAFSNYPFLLTQISEIEPRRVFPVDPKQGLTVVGTISPDIRRFVARPGISTVAQFRTTDYGYENCTLLFSVPEAASTTEQTSINIYSLSTTARLGASKLSWSTRPQRELVAGIWLATNTTEVVHSWRCKWGQYQTFEFAYSGSGPGLAFWQNPKVEKQGAWFFVLRFHWHRLTFEVRGRKWGVGVALYLSPAAGLSRSEE
ncbi:hypothetical protein EVG20_g6488 [Dentipellis fragilis]|uniref:Ubiquitin 3 binding protein But2 C-terminal domain-containing protein n=1 Tax=Dentipellis fragilis TaxID=205917 RepID=A0A4Y9YKU6_9AGAM|nr:hypothetical protein EVG20_g6488 [Dentipellis fragilis]